MRREPSVNLSMDSSSTETEVARVLTTYFEQLEAGERPDLERLCDDHPAVAERVRDCLSSLQVVDDIAGVFSMLESPTEQVLANFTLGDFRVIREIGRGGMGVVYEAEQVSLERSVAIKVLPFAALLDKRQLERFKNEARAAAMLKHPNIVSVFQIGYERGIHYFAMELIEGQSLAEAIIQLQADGGNDRQCDVSVGDTRPIAQLSTQRHTGRKSYYRSVAELGCSTAKALHYAHQEGVVHRDLKPSNLLIDEDGTPHIADFGLARIQAGRDITMTGDVVGTLRYMSPEQASGQHSQSDHRGDIYSLGITLYELLTLRPAFDDQDRQRLLQNVINKSPLHPRQIDPEIPVDLETIVLKATEKEPSHRYSTADALSEDLERFLAKQPIQARRSTQLYRLHQWSLRNRSLAMMGALTAAIVLTLAIVGTLFSIKYAILARRELEARRSASSALAQSEADRSKLQTVLADMVATTKNLTSIAGTEEIQLKLLDEAVSYYQQRLESGSVDDQTRFEAANAFFLLQRHHHRQDDNGAAKPWAEKSLRITNRLLQGHPENDRYLYQAVLSLQNYANIESELHASIRHNRRSVELGERLVRLNPKDRTYWRLLNFGRYFLGSDLVKQGKLQEAFSFFKAADESCREQCESSNARDYMYACHGQALAGIVRVEFRRHRFAEAEQTFLRGHEIAHMMDARLQEYKEFRTGRAQEQLAFAEMMLSLRRTADAESWLHRAVESIHPVSSVSPDYGWARHTERLADLVLARIHLIRGRHEDALAGFTLVLDRQQAMSLPTLKSVEAAYLRGTILWNSNQQKRARLDFQRAIALAESPLDPHQNVAEYSRRLAFMLATCPDPTLRKREHALQIAESCVQPEVGATWQLVGISACAAEQWARALSALQRGADLRNDGDAFDRLLMAKAHWHLDDRQEARRQFDKAVAGKDDPLGFWNYSYDGQLEELELEVRQMMNAQ